MTTCFLVNWHGLKNKMPNLKCEEQMQVPHDIDAKRQELGQLEDPELMHMVVDGSQQAFATLLKRHLPYAIKLALRYTQDIGLAEDIAQESFSKLWRKAYLWSDAHQVKFTTWFYRIIVNTAIDYQRKRTEATLSEMPDVADPQEQVEKDYAKKQQKQRILTALETLPERQKMALTLCFFQEYSNKEAADMMEISVKALETLLIRGKRQLRAVFAQDEERKG